MPTSVAVRPDTGQQARRAERYRLMRAQWTTSSVSDVRDCHRVPAPTPDGGWQDVELWRNDHGGSASFRGLVACDRVHLCPVCAAKLRHQRAVELADVLDRWLAAGNSAVFITVTVRHHARDDLAELWGDVRRSWGEAMTGRWGQWMRDRYGIAGTHLATEVTHGPSGWNPHMHNILFIRGSVEDLEERSNLEDRMIRSERIREKGRSGRWRVVEPDGLWLRYLHGLKRRGRDAVRDHGGLDVQWVTKASAEAIAHYVAGLGWVSETVEGMAADKATLEATRMDLKKGGAREDGDHRAPFEILEDALDGGEARDWAIWREWEAGSKGRHANEWTGTIVEEAMKLPPSSDELIDETDEALVWRFGPIDRFWLNHVGGHADALTAAEHAGTVGVSVLVRHWGGLDTGYCRECFDSRALCVDHDRELMREWRKVVG